ncbi:unnamed protein product [Caenorhabditis bovis]|uniref:beta-N-acetylhexosaminidase n=1 Tax=Caenorhabditis bovis TaxID=2654633 RepID=A0A8S1F3F3_9PELO|nr:unnamed protein product [Caenorhabditis bovis]
MLEWMDRRYSLQINFVPLMVITSRTSMMTTDVLLEVEVNRTAGADYSAKITETKLEAIDANGEGFQAESITKFPIDCDHLSIVNLIWKLPIKGSSVKHKLNADYTVDSSLFVNDFDEKELDAVRKFVYKFSDEVELSVPEINFEICTQILSQQPGAQLCRAMSPCHFVISIRCLKDMPCNLLVVLDADERIWTLTERTKVVAVKESGLGQLALSVIPVVAGFLPFPTISIYECQQNLLNSDTVIPGSEVLYFNRTAGKQIRVLSAHTESSAMSKDESPAIYGNLMQQLYVKLCIVFALVFVWIFVVFGRDEYSSTRMEIVGNLSPKETRRFREVIVHIDLKGAPPLVEYLESFFELLATQYVDGVLIEYEDMFPFSGKIRSIRRNVHYTKEDIRRINEAAARNNLEVIPLIQTFGHLEFVLKKPKFRYLSESPVDLNTICASEVKAIEFVETMMNQIRELHPNSTRIHIGSDEAYHIAEDVRCLNRMEQKSLTKSKIKLDHISRIGKMAKDFGFETVFAWNDMFDKEPVDVILESGIQKFITPVVWGYAADVTVEGYFPPGLFDRIDQAFDKFYVASAFKGANGANQMFSNISVYLENHRSYVDLLDIHEKAGQKVHGIFVTGWSRFSHLSELCEILPVSIPSLVVDLMYINYQYHTLKLWSEMKKVLKCRDRFGFTNILIEWALNDCDFAGFDAFKAIMIDWKSLVDRKKMSKYGDDDFDEKLARLKAEAILKNVRESLSNVLYKRDIEEIIQQYLRYFENLQVATQKP